MLIVDICLNFPRETQRAAHLMYIFELRHRGVIVQEIRKP